MTTVIVPTIENHTNGLIVTSETIAEGSGVQHKNVLLLVRNNMTDLEEFGRVAFETRPFMTAGGPQAREVALLNEQQSTLLMTYQRNTDQVKAFKLALVKAFFQMAKKLSAPAVELTPELLMAKALIAADVTMKQQTRELEAARPAVEYTSRYVSNNDAVLVSAFAAQHGMTSQAAFTLLKDAKIVYRLKVGEHFSSKRDRIVEDHEYRAYAPYLHLFDLRPQHNAPRYHNGQVRQTLYVRQAHALELGALIGLGSTSVELEIAS